MRRPLSPVPALCLFLGLFCGCIGPSSQRTRLYVLTAVAAEVPLPETRTPPSVEVASVRIPRYLERPQIVTRSGEHRLELAEFDQWGGNLRKNIAQVVAENLSRLLGGADVTFSPQLSRTRPDYRLEMEVLQFEKDGEGRVRLSVRWRLTRGETGGPATTRTTALSGPPVAPGGDFDRTVSAMSDAVGQLCEVIAAAVLDDDAPPSRPSGGQG